MVLERCLERGESCGPDSNVGIDERQVLYVIELQQMPGTQIIASRIPQIGTRHDQVNVRKRFPDEVRCVIRGIVVDDDNSMALTV
jgi:hypothetical protein